MRRNGHERSLRLRAWLALPLGLLLAGSACGASSDSAAGQQGHIDRCVDRIAQNVKDEPVTDDLRRYIRTAYCEPFDRRGWVYDDGALKIDSYTQRGSDAVCMEQQAGEAAVTVPCPSEHDPVLDCAALRHVRRSEVEAFLEEMQRTGTIKCDDGTPLSELGVPG